MRHRWGTLNPFGQSRSGQSPGRTSIGSPATELDRSKNTTSKAQLGHRARSSQPIPDGDFYAPEGRAQHGVRPPHPRGATASCRRSSPDPRRRRRFVPRVGDRRGRFHRVARRDPTREEVRPAASVRPSRVRAARDARRGRSVFFRSEGPTGARAPPGTRSTRS